MKDYPRETVVSCDNCGFRGRLNLQGLQEREAAPVFVGEPGKPGEWTSLMCKNGYKPFACRMRFE